MMMMTKEDEKKSEGKNKTREKKKKICENIKVRKWRNELLEKRPIFCFDFTREEVHSLLKKMKKKIK